MNLFFTEKDFWKLLPFAAKNIDDPIADYAILPTFKLLNRLLNNFKVAITGEGGDEFLEVMEDIENHYFFKKNIYKGAFRKLKNFNRKLLGFLKLINYLLKI